MCINSVTFTGWTGATPRATSRRQACPHSVSTRQSIPDATAVGGSGQVRKWSSCVRSICDESVSRGDKSRTSSFYNIKHKALSNQLTENILPKHEGSVPSQEPVGVDPSPEHLLVALPIKKNPSLQEYVAVVP